jgi:hypothetical protein
MWRAPAEPRIGHTGPWPPLASVPSMAIVGASGQRQHVAAAPAASTRSQQQHAVAAPGAGTRGQQWHAASNGMKLFITIELPPLHFNASSATGGVDSTTVAVAVAISQLIRAVPRIIGKHRIRLAKIFGGKRSRSMQPILWTFPSAPLRVSSVSLHNKPLWIDLVWGIKQQATSPSTVARSTCVSLCFCLSVQGTLLSPFIFTSIINQYFSLL